MENVIAGIVDLFRREEQVEGKAFDINDEIVSVRRKIDAANSRFDQESDGDLIEASIYEIQALTMRYRYLLRMLKEKKPG